MLALLCAGLGGAVALAQYPGRAGTAPAAAPMLRSIAVLEWTGPEDKPTASRLIPIAVYDGTSYHLGGLYMAQPAPLAVLSDTEYILQKAGVPQGLFDVSEAGEVQGYWLGYGSWKKLPHAVKPHTLQPTPELAQIKVKGDPNRPHFKSDTPEPAAQSPSGGAPAGSGSQKPQAAPPPAPSGRPVLRHRDKQAAASADQAPETPIYAPDPNRPHLTYGRPPGLDVQAEPEKLSGNPPHTGQMIAVSDAVDRPVHSFLYSWANPASAQKMQQAMEAMAQKALAAWGKPAETPPVHKTSSRHAASRRERKRVAAAALPALTDVQFHAYELTYTGGATLVLTARTAAQPGEVKYITMIAQPDIYGTPLVLFQSVTSDPNLDITPRMRLAGVVDARANNRGDLVFELRGRYSRQFAIYLVSEGRVEQVFTTGPLAL